MAPEMMKKLPVTEKADVYSFGVLLWQIYTRKKPFARYKTLKSPQEKNEFAEAVWNGYRPTIPLSTPPLLANLISRCWATDTTVRPTFNQVIQSLHQVLFDYSFRDPSAQLFWDLATSDSAEVTSIRWKALKAAFISSFDQTVDHSAITWKPISTLLCDPLSATTKIVKIERFSSVVNCFSPFFPPWNFIQRLSALLAASYPTYGFTDIIVRSPIYYPFTERDTAIALLVGRPSGTFLIRNSSTSTDYTPFILSYTVDQSIKHTNIICDKLNQQYVINSIHSKPNTNLENFVTSSEVINSLGLKYSTHEEADE